VQTNTIEGPGGEAGVMRLKGSNRGLAMALDGNGRWCYLDPELGAAHAVAEAARKVACTGATPVAATNCLNFGNPEKPEIMWQFSQVVDGLAEACEALQTPITGGNVSLYNETLGEGIYPTPVVGIVGILDDLAECMTFHFRQPERDVILLCGGPRPQLAEAEAELGSSEYARHILCEVWGVPPELSLKQEAALQKCLRELIRSHLIESAHDCSDGGLAVALAESAFPCGIGAEINLDSSNSFPEAVLFGEEASRVLISCDPEKTENIKRIAVNWGLRAERFGRTIPQKLEIRIDGEVRISASVSELKQVWEDALPRALHPETPEHLVSEILQKS
ncbi:MAG: AIR synthase related protein, partial [Candidatus Angelobacter sp.]